MPYKVSIVGIDGSGKNTCASKVFDDLSKEFKVGLISRLGYIGNKVEKKELFQKSMHFLDGLQGIIDSLSTKTGVTILNTLDAMFVWPLKEQIMSHYNPDIILYPRDKILDPAIYITFYFPIMRKLGSKGRLGLCKFMTGSTYPDLLVHLDIPIEIAYERIIKRIERERNKKNGRIKARMHMHENLYDMKMLQEYFLKDISFLQLSGINVYSIDANDTEDNLAKKISTHIKNQKNLKQ